LLAKGYGLKQNENMQGLHHGFVEVKPVVISKNFNKLGSKCNHIHILGVA